MNSAAAIPTPGAVPERADLAAWLAVGAGMLAAFMALLDISIVNSALPVIQGEIGATQSEGTWVGTAYLVAEIVIMPLTAWLERMLSLRRVLLISATLFTVFSVVCGFAPDLTTMILGRVGQGLAGGALIPTGMTIMAKRLPPRQQSIGVALYAAAAMLGPILGPLLGGWLTENFSWHYAFFINVPICTGLALLIILGVPGEPTHLDELPNADWYGIFGMMIGLGAITVLLEEGHRELWFESPLIWRLAVASALGFTLVAIGQFGAKTPVLRLALLRNTAFSANIFLTMVTGMIIFSTIFIVPQFLVAIAGYNALQAGQVLIIGGFFSLVGSLLYPVLVARIDVRIMVAIAFVIAGTGSYLGSLITADSVGIHFVPTVIMMGLGTSFSAIPLQQAALTAVSVEDAGQATSIFNIARNVGGSLGLATIASLIDQRLETHHWRLHETIGANDPAVAERLGALAGITGGRPESFDGAYRLLDGIVMQQSVVMSFGDVFFVLSLASFLSIPLVLLLKPIDSERSQGMMH